MPPREAPGHLISLPGDEFSSWPVVLFRSAGFAGDWVRRIADPHTAAAADHVLAAQAHAQAEQQRLVQALEQRAQQTEGDEHHRVIKALRLVRKGRMPALAPVPVPVPVDESAWARARDAVAEARSVFDERFMAAREQLRAQLCELAGTEPFRRAVAWQNRRALHLGIDKLVGATGVYNKQTRKHEHLAAGYLQRYCTKNETIGFFGPLCWATVDRDEPGLLLRHGDELIDERHVYFEGWCIAALAAKIGDDERLRPWLRPRRLPLVGLHEGAAHLPFSPQPISLSPAEARLLAACDGTRTAARLAADLSSALGVRGHDEVFDLIDVLCKKGLVAWKLEVPLDMHPERHLRDILNGITDDELRAATLAKLDRLEAAREAVSNAADASALEASLSELDATFHDLTGQRTTRLQGKTYAGRTLVYVESTRAAHLVVGRKLLDAAGPPLSLLMRSIRWFTHEMARTYRDQLVKLHHRMAARIGSNEIPYLRFWLEAQSLFLLRPSARAAAPAHVQELIDRLQQKWGQILDDPGADSRRLAYRCDDIRPAVEELFAAPCPGWSWARYSSPDLMINAASVDAINRGEFELVLGELAMASHTLLTRTSLAHHRDPGSLLEMIDKDHEQPLICPLIPSDMYPYRVHPYLNNRNGYELAWAPEAPGYGRGTPLLAGDLIVAPYHDGLVVRTRNGTVSFDVLEVLGLALATTCDHCFSFMPRTSHRPRISFDKLVIQRERWLVPVTGLPFADVRDRGQQFMDVRSWAREQGIPRFIFVMAPAEEKPIYIDLDSPIFIEILCKLIRDSRAHDEHAAISVTEMLPAHDGMWLSDSRGNHYSSELRLALVDPRRPGATGADGVTASETANHL